MEAEHDRFQELGKLDRKHIGQELATGSSALIISGKELSQYNPDDLVGKKGLEIYDDMLNDDMVKASLFVKKFSRLSTQWHIRPGTDDKKDIEIAEFFERQLHNMPGTVLKMLLGMMTALDYGFSIMEKNLYYVKDGMDRGKVGLSNIKSRKPHDFYIKQDKHSNITALTQMQGLTEVALPIEKFILLSWMPQWENPYGTSDLRAAYEPWWSKDVVLKFWNIFLERFPAPIFIGFYPPGTSKDDRDDLFEVLDDLQIHTSAVMPDGIRVETIEAGRVGVDAYARAIDERNRMISRALLIPELLGLAKQSTGSYALGKKQFELFIGVLWHLGNTLEETINEQLTKQYIDLNFPNVQEYPVFQFEPMAEESSETKAKIIQVLSAAGFLDPSDEDTREWASKYMNILPQTKSKASKLAAEALDWSEPFKFCSPDGKEMFMVNIDEEMARLELLDDALLKG